MSDHHGETRTRVIEGGGHRWTVSEARSAVPDTPRARCLTFETDGMIRRVRNYPPDWFDWADSELYDLSRTR